MQEWFEKYRDIPRFATNASVDKPMILFLGLTLFDFISGVSIFILIVMIWDSGLSIPFAIIGAFASAGCAKWYRTHFPPLFLSHVNWSFGLQKFKHIPIFFSKQRFRLFGP